MKVYRYMSRKEFDLLQSGASLHNDTIRDESYSNAHGFCFLAETTTFTTANYDGDEQDYTYSPEDCLCFLDGIVTEDVLVEFEVKDFEILRQGFGSYMNPISTEYDMFITITEYSSTYYDKYLLKPLRAKFNNIETYGWVEKTPWVAVGEI